jgi:hypothetical protein
MVAMVGLVPPSWFPSGASSAPQRHLHHQNDTIYVADFESGPDTGAHELMGITPQQEELRAAAGVSAMPPAPGIVLHRGK